MTSDSLPLVLTDVVLREAVSAADAVEWMHEAVRAADAGRLLAPARVHTDLGGGRLVFTTGALSDEWFGYRSYDTFEGGTGEQLVVLHSADSGRVEAIAVGNAVGQMRTGALGGVAADVLARRDASTLGIIGSGRQAWSQVWAISAVRRIRSAKVYSRTPAHAEAFAERVRGELAIDCIPVDSAQSAVRDEDIVVLATDSHVPVIDPRWLTPGAHVTTVGPKEQGGAEFGTELLEAAHLVVTDSLAQLHGYDTPSIVATSRHADRVLSLGALASGHTAGRQDDSEMTLYLSVGLAGTEVHLLHRAAAAIRARKG